MKKLKKMSVRKIGWSSRQGLSLEFYEPGTFQLNLLEATYLHALLNAGIDQKDLDEAFTPEEQMLLYDYERMKFHKLVESISEADNIDSIDAMHRMIRDDFSRRIAFLKSGPEKYIEEGLGWESLDRKRGGNTLLERELVDLLHDEMYTQPGLFVTLVSTRISPPPSKEIIRQVEEKFGPQNWFVEIDRRILAALDAGIIDRSHYEKLLEGDKWMGHPSPPVMKRLKKEVGSFRLEPELDRILRHLLKKNFSKQMVCMILNEWPDRPSLETMALLEAHYGRFSFASS